MGLRDDFITRHRQRWDRQPNLAIFSAAQRSAWLDDALAEYSSYSPRPNIYVSMSITTGERDVVLPVDYLSASRDQLTSLEWAGQAPSPPSRYPFPFQGTGYDRLILSQGPYVRPQYPAPMVSRRIVDEEPRYVLTLHYTPSRNETKDFYYTGAHILNEDESTLSPEDERRIFMLMHAYAMSELAKQTMPVDYKQAQLISQSAKAERVEALRGLGAIGGYA